MAKYLIELQGPNDERVMFAPIGKQPLRGRLDSGNINGRRLLPVQIAFFSQVKTVPGLVLELDTEKKRGRYFDPLGETEAGRTILRKINSIFERSELRQVTGGEKKAWDTAEYKLNTDSVKEWAFHMRTLIDCDLAKPAPGSTMLPEAEEILKTWPGKMRRDPLSDNREFSNEYPQFVYEVSEKRSAAAT